MKKILAVIFAAVMIVTFATGVVAAAGNSDLVAPCWNYMDSIEVNMTFSGNVGTATATITRIYGVTTNIEATLSVYEQDGSDWVFVDSASGSSARTLFLELDFDAESGVTYKAVVDVTAYGEDGSESDSSSRTKTCP